MFPSTPECSRQPQNVPVPSICLVIIAKHCHWLRAKCAHILEYARNFDTIGHKVDDLQTCHRHVTWGPLMRGSYLVEHHNSNQNFSP